MNTAHITPHSRCLPLAEWPTSDQSAWAVALTPGTALAHWSEGTRRTIQTGYGRWLTYLGARGSLDPAILAGDRVTTELVSSYIIELRTTLSEFSVASRIEQLGNALRALAPGRQWQWLQRSAEVVRSSARAARSSATLSSTEALAHSSGLGDTANAISSYRSLSQTAWPMLDKVAWSVALQPGDVLEPCGVAASWAIATRKLVADSYGYWLFWLEREWGLDPLVAPKDRVTRERLRCYFEEMKTTLAPHTVATRVQGVGNAMRALAPDQDWRWIQRAADRIRARAIPVRNKRERLRLPDELVSLGMGLMDRADGITADPPVERATAYRDGLLIALLAYRPERRRNISSIRFGQHLVKRGAAWWLMFSANETKTGHAPEFPFPAELAPRLERYVAVHRTVLLNRGERRAVPITGLWVSNRGRQMGEAAITCQVRNRTNAAFGKPLSPHMFRDAVATGIAINAPSDMHLVPSLLGHTTSTASEQHYNLAGSIEAGRRHHATLKGLR